MNLLMGNKCLDQPPPDSHTKRTETTNSYPPHPSHQFYFIGKGKKKDLLKKEEERKKENNKDQLGNALLLTRAKAAPSKRRAARLWARPRHENYRAASQTYPCPVSFTQEECNQTPAPGTNKEQS